MILEETKLSTIDNVNTFINRMCLTREKIISITPFCKEGNPDFGIEYYSIIYIK